MPKDNLKFRREYLAEFADDEDKEMTPLAKRHNEIVRERYPEDEVEEEDEDVTSPSDD